ncbi:MAG: GTPase domain-containing protein [Myxococcota bacterium]|nr:GTPase domain-containing protein [Myxococcota bacterium]MDW8362527.1 GTPase domain-containing protein [Myxococcales bacterium]
MQLDFANRELTIKLVYYGPALSGKTTNLQALHRLLDASAAGRLMTLETRDDRTLFFDMLPVAFDAGSGLRVRFKVFTVPGQVMHAATRRMVLQGADGVAFIADSQRNETRANQQAYLDLQQNLRELGVDPARLPVVIQFNKRDLPDIRTDAEIDALARHGTEPVYKAVALRGAGVLETFFGLVERTWDALEREHRIEQRFGVTRAAVLERLRARTHRTGTVP